MSRPERHDIRRHDIGRHDIEFLAPDESAFGESTNAEFVGLDSGRWSDDEPKRVGPRWPRGAAGALVIGLLAAGVIAADPWGNSASTPAPLPPAPSPAPSPAPAPAPSRAIPTETSTGTFVDDDQFAEGDPLADVPDTPIGFVLDTLPTRDWMFSGNYSIPDSETLQAFPLQIWAEPNATRTSLRWISIRVVEETQTLSPDAVRVTAGTRPAIVIDRSGVTIVRVDDDVRSLGYELEGFGMSLDAMLDLASSVDFVGEGLDVGPAGVHLEGMNLEFAGMRPPWSTAVFGNPKAVTNYFDTNDERGVEIAFRPATDGTDARLLLERTEHPGTFLLSGDPRQPVALRPMADGLVTVTGFRVDAETVTAIADSIRRATPDEWRSLIVRTNRGLGTGGREGRLDNRGQRGELSDGVPWNGAQTPRFVFGGSLTGNWYGEVTTPAGAVVQALSNPHFTVLVATVTWPNPERTLRVTVGDRPPVDITLEQLGEEPVFGAVFPFTEREPYTFELR